MSDQPSLTNDEIVELERLASPPDEDEDGYTMHMNMPTSDFRRLLAEVRRQREQIVSARNAGLDDAAKVALCLGYDDACKAIRGLKQEGA